MSDFPINFPTSISHTNTSGEVRWISKSRVHDWRIIASNLLDKVEASTLSEAAKTRHKNILVTLSKELFKDFSSVRPDQLYIPEKKLNKLSQELLSALENIYKNIPNKPEQNTEMRSCYHDFNKKLIKAMRGRTFSQKIFSPARMHSQIADSLVARELIRDPGEKFAPLFDMRPLAVFTSATQQKLVDAIRGLGEATDNYILKPLGISEPAQSAYLEATRNVNTMITDVQQHIQEVQVGVKQKIATTHITIKEKAHKAHTHLAAQHVVLRSTFLKEVSSVKEAMKPDMQKLQRNGLFYGRKAIATLLISGLVSVPQKAKHIVDKATDIVAKAKPRIFDLNADPHSGVILPNNSSASGNIATSMATVANDNNQAPDLTVTAENYPISISTLAVDVPKNPDHAQEKSALVANQRIARTPEVTVMEVPALESFNPNVTVVEVPVDNSGTTEKVPSVPLMPAPTEQKFTSNEPSFLLPAPLAADVSTNFSIVPAVPPAPISSKSVDIFAVTQQLPPISTPDPEPALPNDPLINLFKLDPLPAVQPLTEPSTKTVVTSWIVSGENPPKTLPSEPPAAVSIPVPKKSVEPISIPTVQEKEITPSAHSPLSLNTMESRESSMLARVLEHKAGKTAIVVSSVALLTTLGVWASKMFTPKADPSANKNEHSVAG